jgi:tRNA pseudouridine38-40 synthase
MHRGVESSVSAGSRRGRIMPDVRFRLVIAYEGSRYAGWQVQRTGTGVQEQLESAITRMVGQSRRVHSSSRTDAGVHALGMVVHVDLPRAKAGIPGWKLALGLNAHLPDDIRVVSAARTRGDFHARFDALGKEYRYQVWNARTPNPLLRNQAWHVIPRLDLAAMRAAAQCMVGRHDFRSFAATRSYAPADTVRTVTACRILRRGSLWTIRIRADGFLYKMCRGMVGTLVQVGQGKFAAGDLWSMLEQRDRRAAGMTAPAHGLILWRVFYGSRKARGRVAAGAGLRGVDG